MAEYVISTDSTADLPVEYSNEHNIVIQDLSFSFGDEMYRGLADMDPKVFYKRMRDGDVAKTNACIPGNVRASFEEILKSGKDILHISFSSGLSASYNVVKIVAEELSSEYPDRKIAVVDSLAAAPGQGLLVYYGVLNHENGMDFDENVKQMEALKLHVCHEFTVEDLKYLARGGRISKTTAVLGTIINVKPVLHVDNEGHLINISKVRGRKQSLNALVDNMGTHLTDEFKNDIVFIGHGDSLADAEYVRDRVKEKYGVKNFMLNYICPTIGAHSGPGTIALFYLGKSRE
ncbi:MAG: DegV family protein [Lachnospiraceae bacterium]|nr:DegV family protein [Lachnospiraceae bacterium]